jgi:signal transduction histidine kinase
LFKIFGKLEQNDESINPSGIGLGLTICNKILNQLGGELSVTSKFNVGSKFNFTLALPFASSLQPVLSAR